MSKNVLKSFDLSKINATLINIHENVLCYLKKRKKLN